MVKVNTSFSAWTNKLKGYDPLLAQRMTEDPNPYSVASKLGMPVPRYQLF